MTTWIISCSGKASVLCNSTILLLLSTTIEYKLAGHTSKGLGYYLLLNIILAIGI